MDTPAQSIQNTGAGQASPVGRQPACVVGGRALACLPLATPTGRPIISLNKNISLGAAAAAAAAVGGGITAAAQLRGAPAPGRRLLE